MEKVFRRKEENLKADRQTEEYKQTHKHKSISRDQSSKKFTKEREGGRERKRVETQKEDRNKRGWRGNNTFTNSIHVQPQERKK